MTILLPALAVAFAAFCVWLTVRIVNRRERWAKRTLAVVVGLPVLYFASFGPWCWITSRLSDETVKVPTFYRYLTIATREHEAVRIAASWYAKILARDREFMPK